MPTQEVASLRLQLSRTVSKLHELTGAEATVAALQGEVRLVQLGERAKTITKPNDAVEDHEGEYLNWKAIEESQ